jgi:hypothetical protein
MLKKFSFSLPLGFILLIALGLRVQIAFFSGLTWWNTDTTEYFTMASAILQGQPFASFPNGYPLVIALAKLLDPSQAPLVLILLQVLCGTMVVWLSYGILTRLTPRPEWASIGSLLVALYPNQLNYTRLLLSETLTTFLVTLGVWLLLVRAGEEAANSDKAEKTWMGSVGLVLAGLAWAGAGAMRSTLLPVVPLLLLVGWGLRLKFKPRWGGILAGFLMGCMFFTALDGIGITRPSNNLGVNLLIAVHRDSQHLDFDPRDDFLPSEQANPLQTYGRFAQNQPVEFVRQRFSALWELWGPWPATEGREPEASFLIGIRFPILVLALLGFWWRRSDFRIWVLVVPIGTITLVHTLTFATPRFTCAVEPIALILAVLALGELLPFRLADSSLTQNLVNK